MQAQGRMIQGGMMGNFIQIYRTEGAKGLWKASFFLTVSYTSTILPCSSECHVFLQCSQLKYGGCNVCHLS